MISLPQNPTDLVDVWASTRPTAMLCRHAAMLSTVPYELILRTSFRVDVFEKNLSPFWQRAEFLLQAESVCQIKTTRPHTVGHHPSALLLVVYCTCSVSSYFFSKISPKHPPKPDFKWSGTSFLLLHHLSSSIAAN